MQEDVDIALVPISRAGRLFPVPRTPHASTVMRWALRGVRTVSGRVLLETVKVGGRRYTTRAAVDRFLTAASRAGAADENDGGQTGVAVHMAELELDAEGIV